MNTFFSILLSFFSFSLTCQVLINEVNLIPSPDAISGAIQSLRDCSSATAGSEYIELYNSSPCQPVDISCYVIGTSGFLNSQTGTFRFPSGTIIPPLGFVSIGGPNSGATFNLYTYCGTSNMASNNNRWYLNNGSHFVMLYDDSGAPVNAVYWSANAADWGTSSTISTAPTPIAAGVGCPSIASLAGPNTIPVANPIVNYAGTQPAMGQVIHRVPDGSANWQNNGAPTVNGCNGVCNTATNINLNATVIQPACVTNNGSITLNPTPAGAYTYTWSPAVGIGVSATGLGTGSYTVTASSGGCTKDTTINLIAPGSITLLSTPTQPSCAGICDGAITVTPSGGAAPYTYAWFDSANNPIGANSPTISALCDGDYSVEVSSSGGATTVVYSESFNAGAGGWTLNVPLAPEGSDPNFFEIDDDEGGVLPGGCGVAGNGDPTLHITSVFFPFGGAAYDAGGLCPFLFCPETHRRAESPLISTIGQTGLTLTFDFIANGDAPNDQATVWYNAGTGWNQLGTALNSGTGICAPQGIWTAYSAALPASCNNIPNLQIAIRWDNNDDGMGSDPSVAINNIEIVTATTATCPATLFTTLTDPPLQDASFTFGDFCESPINGPANIATPGGTFSFNPPPPNGATINSSTGTISNGLPGTYTVEYSLGGACQVSATEAVTIFDNPTPVITGGLQICTGSSAVLDAGAGYTSYNWSTGQTTQTISVSAATAGISVEVTGAGGCVATSPTVDVIQVAAITENSTITICQGQTATIHGISQSVAGMYSATVTTAAGCDSTSNVTLVVDAPPTVDLVTITAETCSGLNDGSISIDNVLNNAGPLPTVYSWDIVPNPQTALVLDLTPGFYTVTVTNPNNGCFSSETFEVMAGPLCCDVTLTTTLEDPPSCDGSDGQITVQGAGGDGNYSYSLNGNPFDPNADFTGLGDGIYNITVQDGMLCDATVTVIFLPAVGPTINAINGTNLNCFGDGSGEIEIDASGGTGTLSYEIELNGTTTTSISPLFENLDAGTYNISVTDENNCEVISAVTLTQPIELTSSVQTTDLVCDTPNSGQIEIIAAGSGTLQYSIDGGLTVEPTNIFSNLSAGIYDVVVLDENGCGVATDVTLSEPTLPFASFAFSPSILNLLESEISIQNNSQNATSYEWEITGTNGYTVNYSTFEPDHTFPGEIASYQICLTATNEEGCADSVCLQVQVSENNVLFVPNTFTPNGDQQNQYFKPVIRGYDELNYDLFIFNRWGEMVFESHNMEIGWDGNYDNIPAQDGMYTWKIIVKDPNRDERITYTGHLNLIR